MEQINLLEEADVVEAPNCPFKGEMLPVTTGAKPIRPVLQCFTVT